ncbi:LOW QUALITY PROTEIN: myeloid-associated differentiation marker-like [Megaptera novaeangliae]
MAWSWCPLEGQQAPGLHWQLGLKEPCESSPFETGQLSLRREQAGEELSVSHTLGPLQEALCEAGLQPCWRDRLEQFHSSPSSMGKVGSMPASLLGQKTPTGLPRGHSDPGILPSSSPLCRPRPSPKCILRAVTTQRCSRWQLLLVMAAGRKGRDTCLFRLLWKEAMALKLLSTCVAFSLVARVGTWSRAISNWYLFIWYFCFVVTLIILIVELCGLQSCFPLYWYNFSINHACHATLFCLSASIVFAITYIQFLPQGPTRDHAIAATAFSCIAAVAYATEVVWTWACYLPGELTSLMGTMHSLLKLLQNFVANVIFAFICSPHLCQPQPALVWCVAVYPICFLLGTMALLLGLVDCDNRQPIFCIFLLGLSLLSVLPYASALVLWPLYQFSKKFGGQPQRSSDVSCSDELPSTMCICDQQLAVAILTAINLLTYMADTVYWALLVFVGTEDHPRGSQFPLFSEFFCPLAATGGGRVEAGSVTGVHLAVLSP